LAIDDMMSGGMRGRRDGPSRSGARAAIFWVIALVAGLAAAVLLKWYMDRSAAPPAPPLAKLVVAAVDLPVATTIRSEHIKEVEWPESAQPLGAIRDVRELVGRVVVAKVVKGEPILGSKVAARDAGRGLTALIPENLRAVAVRVDDVVGVAGFVHPEDRVDVLVTLRVRRQGGGEEQTVSKVFLQNVKVLAVGKELETSEGSRNKPVSATVATLLVTPEESEKLALASTHGKLLLTLRSWSDDSSVETPGAVATSLLVGADPLERVASERHEATTAGRKGRKEKENPPPATAPPVAASPPQKDVVEILRGDRFEERKFDVKEKQ
jgi:pilus assembly protein CpaB